MQKEKHHDLRQELTRMVINAFTNHKTISIILFYSVSACGYSMIFNN